MATRKNVTPEALIDEELVEIDPVEEAQYEDRGDGLTVKVAPTNDGYKGPMVTVFIPALEDPGSAGIKVDQYEHVTIANEVKEKTYYVLRGEPVEVPVPVFIQLKNRYPKL